MPFGNSKITYRKRRKGKRVFIQSTNPKIRVRLIKSGIWSSHKNIICFLSRKEKAVGHDLHSKSAEKTRNACVGSNTSQECKSLRSVITSNVATLIERKICLRIR